MFTAEHRDHVRARVLDLARTDPRVTAGALTGSTAVGAQDAWSDIDVAFGIADGITPEAVLQDWTEVLDRNSASSTISTCAPARLSTACSFCPVVSRSTCR